MMSIVQNKTNYYYKDLDKTYPFIHTYIHIYKPIYIHLHIHAYIFHTHLHTHTYIMHTYIPAGAGTECVLTIGGNTSALSSALLTGLPPTVVVVRMTVTRCD